VLLSLSVSVLLLLSLSLSLFAVAVSVTLLSMSLLLPLLLLLCFVSKDVDYVCISDNYWLGEKKPCITYGLRYFPFLCNDSQCLVIILPLLLLLLLLLLLIMIYFSMVTSGHISKKRISGIAGVGILSDVVFVAQPKTFQL